MIVAITGASGFIGTNLALRLKNAGHEVRAISLRHQIDALLLEGSDAVIHLSGACCAAMDGGSTQTHRR